MSTKPQQSKEVAPAPAAQLPVEAATERGVAQLFNFSDFNAAYTAAEKICKTSLVPKQFQGNPAEIIACWQYGMELGLPPMQSLTAICVINGRPGLYGDGFLAVIRSSPEFVDCIETFDEETKTAQCIMRRRHKLDVVRTFSIEDAKQAGLINKEGPWRGYPKRMCQMRARGFAGRDQFADVLRGMAISDELQDLPPEREIGGEVLNTSTGGTRSDKLLSQLRPNSVSADNAAPVESNAGPTTDQTDAAASSVSAPASSGPTVAELLEQLAKAKTFEEINIVADVARSLDPEPKQEVLAAVRTRSKELKGAV